MDLFYHEITNFVYSIHDFAYNRDTLIYYPEFIDESSVLDVRDMGKEGFDGMDL